jgi:Tol biopolymer transport system component
VRVDGSEQTRLTNDPAIDDSPAWSPDGSIIAFAARRDGNREIYLVQPDGSGLQRVTNDPGDDDIPFWSPDGSRIAIQAVHGTNYDIDIVRVADRARTHIASAPEYDGMHNWSRDGKQLAFISGRDGYDALYVVDANGGGLRRLTSSGSLNPDWSRRNLP